MDNYDVIILGAGPAGLTAAIYATRYKLNIVVIGKEIGGTASYAHKVCNYPSYNEISGTELMMKIMEQVKVLGVEILNEEVVKITGKDGKFAVKTKKKDYLGKKIIYAGGTVRSKLNVGEDKYIGKGVSYCATCDAPLFNGKEVVVVGGSNAALTSSLLLSEYASKVYSIYRGEKFNGEPSWIELVNKNKKIKSMFNEEIAEFIGENFVEGVKLKSGKELKVEGVFIEIGGIPESYVLSTLNVKKDKKGYIITDKSGKTSVKGFYAAGDITDGILKQIITACGEGAVAGFGVYGELKG